MNLQCAIKGFLITASLVCGVNFIFPVGPEIFLIGLLGAFAGSFGMSIVLTVADRIENWSNDDDA